MSARRHSSYISVIEIVRLGQINIKHPKNINLPKKSPFLNIYIYISVYPFLEPFGLRNGAPLGADLRGGRGLPRLDLGQMDGAQEDPGAGVVDHEVLGCFF